MNLGIANDKSISLEEAATRLLKSAKISSGWQIGKTMVFMKPDAMKEMTRCQRESLSSCGPVVEMIEVLFFIVGYLYRVRP